jgi:phosphate transport system substrate-binding protein
MTLTKSAVAFVAASALAVSLQARDQIKIVGSSTVYPFSSKVSEILGATTKYPTPVVESTGSGGGFKLFCAGNGMDTPDITNASSRMKTKVLETCHKNGVKDITEFVIGFDGIVLAESAKNTPTNITKKQLLLAVAKEVPSKDGKSLIANPYKKWSDIDASLPNREIVIYGPPKSSGTRAAFEDMILKGQTKKMSVYTDIYKKTGNKTYKKYKLIRTDGAYVEAGENDNKIVHTLEKDRAGFGIFGYSFLAENSDKVQGATIDGVAPKPAAIASGKYPIARSLFFYTKNSHASKVPAMDKYVDIMMSEDMISPEGELIEIGLISLPDAERKALQAYGAKRTNLTAARLKQNPITANPAK